MSKFTGFQSFSRVPSARAFWALGLGFQGLGFRV